MNPRPYIGWYELTPEARSRFLVTVPAQRWPSHFGDAARALFSVDGTAWRKP